MKEFKSYCVRFRLLKYEECSVYSSDIYLEHSVCSFDIDTAVEIARFTLSKSLEIHPDRLYLECAYLEV